jgi:hypothetical protein
MLVVREAADAKNAAACAAVSPACIRSHSGGLACRNALLDEVASETAVAKHPFCDLE